MRRRIRTWKIYRYINQWKKYEIKLHKYRRRGGMPWIRFNKQRKRWRYSTIYIVQDFITWKRARRYRYYTFLPLAKRKLFIREFFKKMKKRYQSYKKIKRD